MTIDCKKTRRRIEDFLRKTKDQEIIIKIAEILGVKIAITEDNELNK